MYKIGAPICFSMINEDTIGTYLQQVKDCDIERVLICGVSPITSKKQMSKENLDKLKKWFDYFRANNLEVGVWINGFGHGVELLKGETEQSNYIEIKGIRGESSQYAVCPLDENFRKDYLDGIRKLAQLSPDIIMIDDDFRINGRFAYYMGCFCEKHKAIFDEMVGEKVPFEKLEELIFTGGKNKYRTAYMNMLKKTLIDFAKEIRETIDSVNPKIRAGSCISFENWDLACSVAELAKTLAGSNKPFYRPAAAPYCYLTKDCIELARLQADWTKNEGLEVFAEGDVYPRPRYNMPSRLLEMFDIALVADHTLDGDLKYMFEYTQPPLYETGYIDAHIRNKPLRKEISQIFDTKKSIGVYNFNPLNKTENWELPTQLVENVANKVSAMGALSNIAVVSSLSLPLCYEVGEYPTVACGENARYIQPEMMKNGVITDAIGAKILTERGIDVGLLEEKQGVATEEFYIEENGIVSGLESICVKEIKVSEKAKVLTTFEELKSPASYIYQNQNNQKFYVLASDIFLSNEYNSNYFDNYYRQRQVVKVIEWLCGKKFPGVCFKQPKLYNFTAKDEKSVGILLINAFMDEIHNAKLELDKEYKSVKFVNCEGVLEKNELVIKHIPAYGCVAVELQN